VSAQTFILLAFSYWHPQ